MAAHLWMRRLSLGAGLVAIVLHPGMVFGGEQSVDFGTIHTAPPWTFNNVSLNPGCASSSGITVTLTPTGSLHTGTIGGEQNLTTSPGGFCYFIWSVDFEPYPNQLIRPKFKVVDVVYAPPGTASGQHSNFTYSQTFSSSSSETFSNDITGSNSAQVSSGFSVQSKFDDVLALGITASASSSNASGLTQSYTNTFTTSTGLSSGYSILGNATNGLSHQNDTLFIWLNPVEANFAVSGDTIVLGWGSNANDPYTGGTGAADIIPLSVTELQQCIAGVEWSSILSSSEDVGRVGRAWDSGWTSGSVAITPSDCQTILDEDKLVNASYNPINDERYDVLVDNSGNPLTVNFSPTATPQEDTYSASSSTTSSFGQSLKDTYTVSSSLGVSGSYAVTLGLTSSSTWTYDIEWSSQVQTGSTNSAAFAIYTPTSGYTGPTLFLVLKDNLYGTFSLWAPPSPVSITSVKNKSVGAL
jgi:hypothetical protein